MPSVTPNRSYPYPLPADPVNIPGDLQAFAEAVDLDVQNLSDGIITRPFARVRSVSDTSQVFPADTVTEAAFDFVDYDNASISNLTSKPTRLTPTSPGLWCIWGLLQVPFAQSDTRDVFLRVNGSDQTRTDFHVNDPTGSDGQAMTASAVVFMNGTTDYITMTFEPTGGLDDYKIRNKQMGCFRLTES